MKNWIKEYVEAEEEESEEWLNREDVWYFYAYFSATTFQILDEFIKIADIPTESEGYIQINDNPVKSMCLTQFDDILDAFSLLIDYYHSKTDHYNYEEFVYKGRVIDFERGDTIVSLLTNLHLFVNVLPYLNSRHFQLSKERYDTEKFHKYSYEELEHLDRTLVKSILPTFLWFANHSIFCPKQLTRLYGYPKQKGQSSNNYNCSKQWDIYLSAMVKSWEWLKDREIHKKNTDWENVPDEIYYGFHLFAEYLPEMQND